MTPATYVYTHRMNTYTRIFMSSWHKGMKVVRARRRVPFPRINQGNELMEGQRGEVAILFSERGDLPPGTRVISRESETSSRKILTSREEFLKNSTSKK